MNNSEEGVLFDGAGREVASLAECRPPGTSRSPLRRLNEAARAADAASICRLSGSGNVALSLGHKEVPVTQLRTIMLEDLQRRNFSQTAVKTYLKVVEDFARRFHRPPDQLGLERPSEN
jgi:hypothetical protein